jgi:hypothetical protein
MPLTRRSLLLGAGSTVAVVAAAGVAVDEGWLPGRYRVRRALGLTGSFVSQDRLGTAVGCSVIYPGPRPERPVSALLSGPTPTTPRRTASLTPRSTGSSR